jgi:hypothetical protein
LPAGRCPRPIRSFDFLLQLAGAVRLAPCLAAVLFTALPGALGIAAMCRPKSRVKPGRGLKARSSRRARKGRPRVDRRSKPDPTPFYGAAPIRRTGGYSGLTGGSGSPAPRPAIAARYCGPDTGCYTRQSGGARTGGVERRLSAGARQVAQFGRRNARKLDADLRRQSAPEL